jgi:hypothetical protein
MQKRYVLIETFFKANSIPSLLYGTKADASLGFGKQNTKRGSLIVPSSRATN